jgi:predicted DsbA family dithiol-disulfide isomerase
MEKINVEIWSDVVCPFCYIGKRKLELAIQELNLLDQVKIEWKSYQLDPYAEPKANVDCYDYLATRYGKDRDWSIAMHNQVTDSAKEVGLNYRFEKAIPCNTFLAHQLAHFAKTKGKGIEMEELLFQSYFTEGKNLNLQETLVDIATQLGIDAKETQSVLESQLFKKEVERDIQEAQELGVRGVPFFVFNRQYAVSGAQPVSHFKEVLEQLIH